MKTSQTNQQSEKSNFRQWLDAAPILQFVGAGIIGLCATWTTVQLTQNSQAAEIRRASERIEKLEKESVSRELFDERTKNIESLLNRILDNQKKK
ncbi:MAG TPA: hypothetical protein VF692_04825 [Pyrinomonadaceae bacterium]|jgi:predicted amino acid dehydrogenase